MIRYLHLENNTKGESMKFDFISGKNKSNNSTADVPNDNFHTHEFKLNLQSEFAQFQQQQATRFDDNDCLTVDLHCHDHNSDVSDLLFPRILNVPETWLESEKLLTLLKKHGCNAFTITNHNNARSCRDMIAQGEDILVAAEFTCLFPEYELYVHVLAYGFSQTQEVELNHLRQNIYNFVKYAAEHNIPLILAHPLYFYTRNDKLAISLFEKFAVMFARFEVINGQRDLWQTMLTLSWIEDLTPEKIENYALKHQLNPRDFGVDPLQKKILTGGSDDHTGIFSGLCGSKVYIPNLQNRLKTEKKSALVLEAIRLGNIAPFGNISENQKLQITFIDYFSQAFMKLKDPGLLRLLLHRGAAQTKFHCFLVSNLILELRRNKNATVLFKHMHNALHGKKISVLTYWTSDRESRFYYDELNKIATCRRNNSQDFSYAAISILNKILRRANKSLIDNVYKTISRELHSNNKSQAFSEITKRLEIPSQITNLLSSDDKTKNSEIFELIDDILASLLISSTILGSAFFSIRSFYTNRQLLNQFSCHINKHQHPKRTLYLTDTLKDKNGVSHSLSAKLKEIQRANLPVDFIICHPKANAEDHLIVTRPISSFELPNYPEQKFHFPDLMEVVDIFIRGGYDRIVCSTEGPMLLVSLLLKLQFNVPCYFFMHTDWLAFLERTSNLSKYGLDNVRVIIGYIYRLFDGVFVLNNDHKDWLISKEVGVTSDKVFLTAHHMGPVNQPIKKISKSTLFRDANDNTPVLFIACRLSEEKGLLELPEIMSKLRKQLPDIKLVIAGTGPAEIKIKALLPDAKFLGWQTQEQLASLYSSLDLFIFPSQFDTFGNVILQAFSYSMPVISFNCKGPKQLIEHKKSGFLVNNIDEMVENILLYFGCKKTQATLQEGAKRRAELYQAEPIMAEFLSNLGLTVPEGYAQKEVAPKPSIINKTVA